MRRLALELSMISPLFPCPHGIQPGRALRKKGSTDVAGRTRGATPERIAHGGNAAQTTTPIRRLHTWRKGGLKRMRRRDGRGAMKESGRKGGQRVRTRVAQLATSRNVRRRWSTRSTTRQWRATGDSGFASGAVQPGVDVPLGARGRRRGLRRNDLHIGPVTSGMHASACLLVGRLGRQPRTKLLLVKSELPVASVQFPDPGGGDLRGRRRRRWYHALRSGGGQGGRWRLRSWWLGRRWRSPGRVGSGGSRYIRSREAKRLRCNTQRRSTNLVSTVGSSRADGASNIVAIHLL